MNEGVPPWSEKGAGISAAPGDLKGIPGAIRSGGY